MIRRTNVGLVLSRGEKQAHSEPCGKMLLFSTESVEKRELGSKETCANLDMHYEN